MDELYSIEALVDIYDYMSIGDLEDKTPPETYDSLRCIYLQLPNIF